MEGEFEQKKTAMKAARELTGCVYLREASNSAKS